MIKLDKLFGEEVSGLMEKKDLRKEISRLRDQMDLELRRQYSLAIQTTVEGLSTYQKARTVSYFVSFRSEVDTLLLIQSGLMSGKRVVLPITDVENKCLIFSELQDFERELTLSTYGILEPKPEFIRPVSYQEIDLVLTPGLVFDLFGYRIGYGGGFYDRFLGEVDPRPETVALAFDLQVFAEVLPHDRYDIPVDQIVTEKRTILCKENRERGRD